MSVYKKQIGGSHYKDMKIQPSEFINKNKLLFHRLELNQEMFQEGAILSVA